MREFLDSLKAFACSARTQIAVVTLLTAAVAFGVLTQAQADAILLAAAELGIALFGSAWTWSVGHRDLGR